MPSTSISINAKENVFSPTLEVVLESPNNYNYGLMIALALSIIDNAPKYEGAICEIEPNWNQKKEKQTEIVVFFKLIFKSKKNVKKFIEFLRS